MLKVVLVCSFSNAEIRDKLMMDYGLINKIAFRIMGIDITKTHDSAIWNANAIKEAEKIPDVEWHILCLVRFLKGKNQDFVSNNIHYHFIREENSTWYRFLYHQLFTKYTSRYKKNRRAIKTKIAEILPDVVHVIGAENPYYSLSILDVPKSVPTIIQLQALLDRLKNVTKVKSERIECYYKGILEREIINRADYIGTALKEFREYIIKEIKPNAQFLDTTLAMGQEINIDKENKVFDFVYFSANISKAGEEAIKTFSIIHRRHPELTLDIVGGYDEALKRRLDAYINENNMQNAVKFEGHLATHEDVISQIRKARFALLPLKMDFVPNTLREAMANGLPVLTTITDGTPALNKQRQCVMLSEQDDYEAMAYNAELLLNDTELANTLRNNAANLEIEKTNNYEIICNWCKAYYAITKKVN